MDVEIHQGSVSDNDLWQFIKNDDNATIIDARPPSPETIDLLNDDCWLNIFSYLSIYDLLNLRHVSPRFTCLTDDAFRSYRRLSLKLRDLHDKLEYLDDIFLNIVIPNVYSLFMSGGAIINVNLRDQLLRHIPNCIKLEQLELMYFRLDEPQLSSFQSTFKNLKNLSLNRCEIDDNKMLHITELTQLTKLNLTGNTLLTGKHLPNLKSQLDELYLQFCTQIEFTHLAEYLLMNANNLRVLDISFDKMAYDEELLTLIADCQPNLEILNIGEIRIEKFDSISRLKKLKSLSFQQLTAFSQRINVDPLLEGLSIGHLSLLRELDISFCELTPIGHFYLKQFVCLRLLRLKKLKCADGNYDFIRSLGCLPCLIELDISFCNMGNAACLDIISKSSKLTRFNIENSPDITVEFLEKLIPILDEQTSNGTRTNNLSINIRAISAISNNIRYQNYVVPTHKLLTIVI